MCVQPNPALTVAEKADLRDAPESIFRIQVYTVKAAIDVRFHLIADNGIVGRFGRSASTVKRVDQYFPVNGYAGVFDARYSTRQEWPPEMLVGVVC